MQVDVQITVHHHQNQRIDSQQEYSLYDSPCLIRGKLRISYRYYCYYQLTVTVMGLIINGTKGIHFHKQIGKPLSKFKFMPFQVLAPTLLTETMRSHNPFVTQIKTPIYRTIFPKFTVNKCFTCIISILKMNQNKKYHLNKDVSPSTIGK